MLFQRNTQQPLSLYHFDMNIVPQKMQNATKASWHSARSFYCTLLCKFICFCTFRSIIVLEYLCVAILLLIWNTFVFFVPLLPWNALMLSFFYCYRNAFVLLDSYVNAFSLITLQSCQGLPVLPAENRENGRKSMMHMQRLPSMSTEVYCALQ